MIAMDFLALFGVSLLGGAINSVAGGGTFLTFPVLIFLGLSPIQANVTSTIALWPGALASAVAYRREWMQQKEILPRLLIISVAGGALGAVTLLLTPEQRFSALVPWLLLVATLLFTFGRRVIARLHVIRRPASAYALQVLTAFYGGYFGAGIGILMLAMLQLMGLDHIHRMNALKTVLGSAINAAAVAIFIVSGAVVWDVGLVMLLGAVIGGFGGAQLAQRFPPEPVRWFVSAVGFGMSAYFFLR